MPSRPRFAFIAAVLAGMLLAPVVPASSAAGWPKTAPNDPNYDRAEENPALYSPSDEQTYLYSFMPQGSPLATDPEGASGMSVDRAWAEFTIGRADTLIAYIEGGINWRAPDIAELADKVFLNTRELPMRLHDRNRDGWISAPDVPGVKDRNGNHIVDAEDVIATYSDGVDDDRNGYVDDISGWDFYNDQNDPGTVDSAYMHANDQMEQAAAITNNGLVDAGICPRCMIIPIKAGPEAIDRTDDLAQAWLYATDIGSDVLVSVTADLGYSSFMRQAVEYAVHHGVLAVQASNDFDSTDHQGGMWWPHVLPGNGMVSDMHAAAASPDDQEPAAAAGVHAPSSHLTTTYRARSGQTSWGTHNMFTVAVAGGSTSESTPTLGGVAAMLLSYGKTAAAKGLIGRRLSNFEAIQVLRATASDVADPTLAWPGKPGWDLQYGYGRPNLWKAMKAISHGDIPPVGTIESPGWFTWYDPTRTRTVDIRGHVESRRSTRYRWVLEMGLGPEPGESDFRALGRGSGTSPRDLRLGTLDLRSIPKSFASAEFGLSKDKALSTTERYTVTLRLRITDAKGRMGEDRRTIFVRHDDELLPGFPVRIGPSGESQPALVDLNGDGRLEIVFGDADGRVHAIDARTRRELRGWPVTTNRNRVARSHPGVDPGHEPVLGNVAVGDLDHRGRLSVVASSLHGRVYVWDAAGRRRAGWPRLMNTGVRKPAIPRPDLPFTRPALVGAIAPPVLFDMNGDHRLEVIEAGGDGHLHVWRGDGRELAGWPVKVRLPASYQPQPGHMVIQDEKLVTPPVVADLGGDRKPELVIRSQYTDVTGDDITTAPVSHLHAYHADGTQVAGWPAAMQGLFEYYGSAQDAITEGTNAPVAANVDGIGGDEVSSAPVFSQAYLFSGNGTLRAVYGPNPDLTFGLGAGADPTTALQGSLPTDTPVSFTTSGAFGRFGGRLTYAEPGSGGASIIGALLQSGSGVQLKNFLRAHDALTGANIPGFPAFQQGLNFLGSPAFADVSGDGQAEILDGADSSALHAYSFLGAQAPEFPKFTTGWSVLSPSIGDLDGDGKVEVVMVTREGYLFAWRTPGLATGNAEWWRNRHDEWNTGNYGTDTRPPGSARAIRWNSRTGVLQFVAPGDDWLAGRAGSYRVRVGRDWLRMKARVPVGAVETLRVGPGAHVTAIQAVDEAGNLGPIVRLA